MTINEAITKVLKESNKALGHQEIYKLIVDNSYYIFGAKDPASVVRGQIRRHCFGVDFPSASPKKLFIQVNNKTNSRKALYQIWDGKGEKTKEVKEKKDLLPEEQIHFAYANHIKSIRGQLLGIIKQSEPEFFEALVVKLLLRIGYGWDQSLSGNVIGGKGDDGIDGIINEDKLGLEKIYIQAKRYEKNKISPADVRDFIGAMGIKGARKGVFFTSSSFTEQAKQHAKDAQNMTITLIDGEMLTELLIQYSLGVATVKNYTVYEVDKNFFPID